MRIDELAKIDFSNQWIGATREGEIFVQQKDPLWLRWCKTLLQILTGYWIYKPYADMEVGHVAKWLFQHFEQDFAASSKAKSHYVIVLDNLLKQPEHPIRKNRDILDTYREKILSFEKHSRIKTIWNRFVQGLKGISCCRSAQPLQDKMH